MYRELACPGPTHPAPISGWLPPRQPYLPGVPPSRTYVRLIQQLPARTLSSATSCHHSHYTERMSHLPSYCPSQALYCPADAESPDVPSPLYQGPDGGITRG